MLDWLKGILRGWLFPDGPPDDDHYLDVIVSSETGQSIERFAVTGFRGIGLVGISTDGSGERLIREGEVVDQQKFKRLLKARIKAAGVTMTWEEDGEEVEL